jgi:hypothetical protein
VAFLIGTALWDPPLAWWPFGLWYLKPPVVGPFAQPAIPSPEGLLILNGAVPPAPPVPYTVYLHGLIGDVSTNLVVVHVE